jgi:hypothetical protein
MILAHIPHNGEMLPVEVVEAITTGDGRRLAVVRALAGQPFTGHSFNGGPCDSDTANIPAGLLRDVVMTVDVSPVPVESEA